MCDFLYLEEMDEVAIFDTLTSAERAKQLSNPEGDAGLAVAEWLNERNRQGNAQAVALLGITSKGDIMCLRSGLVTVGWYPTSSPKQRTCIIQASISSPTMVEEALRFNAELVAAGRVSLHLRFGGADALRPRRASIVSSRSGDSFLGGCQPGGLSRRYVRVLRPWRR